MDLSFGFFSSYLSEASLAHTVPGSRCVRVSVRDYGVEIFAVGDEESRSLSPGSAAAR